MITDEIKELLRTEPSKPVRIVLMDQQSFTVGHIDFFMVSPDRQTVLLYDQQGRFKIINTNQIKLAEPVHQRRSRPSAE